MEELFELTGHYNLQLTFNEEERNIYASTKTATSILVEDLEKLKEITGAEEAELYADRDSENNFLVQLKLPESEE